MVETREGGKRERREREKKRDVEKEKMNLYTGKACVGVPNTKGRLASETWHAEWDV